MISVNISRVVNRFPGHKSGIIRRFHDDGTFREVCEDYLTCLDALEYWQQSDRAESASRKKEYEMLLGELEEEILRNFNSPDEIAKSSGRQTQTTSKKKNN